MSLIGLDQWEEGIMGKNQEILMEYPRPQLKRISYLNLNGEWQYAIRSDDRKPKKYDGTIIVPYSPETKRSGVERVLQPNERLWYERSLLFRKDFIWEVSCFYILGRWTKYVKFM